MPKLIVTNENNGRREFPITSSLTIGREPGNHVHILEPKASRTHCRIRPENGAFWIEDLESSNGTKVNGEKVKRYALKNGDEVMIGATSIVFEDENAPSKPAPVPAAVAVEALPDDDADCGMTLALSAHEINKLDKQAIQNDGKRDDSKNAISSKPTQKKSLGGTEKYGPINVNPTSASRRMPPRSKATFRIEFILLIGILAIGAVLWLALRGKGEQPRKPNIVANNTRAPMVPPPVPIPVPPVPTGPTIPTKVVEQPDNAAKPPEIVKAPTPPPPAASKENAAAIEAKFTQLLAERDRALASNNFLSARALLSAFVTRYANESIAPRARQELKDTEELIDTAQAATLADAQKAAAANKYRQATQICTRLLSSDPQGKYGKEARDILNRLDTQSEPRYKELSALAEKEMKAGNLEKASEYFEKVTEEIGGTKWAGLAFESQMKALMVRSLTRQLETERRKCEARGEKIEIRISKRWVKGTLVGVKGLQLDVQLASGVKSTFPLKVLEPQEVDALIVSTGLTKAHLEQAYLWLFFERKDLAQIHIDQALKDSAQSAEASKLATTASTVKNLKSYDFSKWQHQMDWEALSGSWSTQDDRYALDSPEGGDTTLKPGAIGGPFSGKNARISFDFELLKLGKGYIFTVEFGENEQHCISLIFSAEGMALNANIRAPSSDKDAWIPAQGPTHVDLNFEGDNLTVVLNGKPSKTLKVDGLSSSQGTLTVRARDTACAIDNVILRNVE